MPSNSYRFQVIEKLIPDVHCHVDGLLGIVKIQMPEQCSDNALFFRIKERERARNVRIIQNTINDFGNWAHVVTAPAIILFPELSVSEEATDWLLAEMATSRIAPNTLIVLGLEHLSVEKFSHRVNESQSREDFRDINFGVNIDRVNTAVIFVKDSASNVFCYYQPKYSRSDYESPRQFISNIIYKLTFGQLHCIVNICSDFFLQEGARPLIGAVMLDIDRLYQHPREHRVDLVLLIQKNPSPMNDLYYESIKCLYYNTPHRIATSDTIICAVNCSNSDALGKFGKSNVSVMRRGRPPIEFKTRHAFEHFAWCSHRTDDHLNNDLHYARWRLRCAGAISFVLDSHPRPWLPGNVESLPVRRPGLYKMTDTEQFQDISPIPEVYELHEVLYNDFESFIDAIFHEGILRTHFRRADDYEELLNNIVASSPHKIMEFLLMLYEVSVNCDHWDLISLHEAFRHFLITLRLLSERYNDLQILDDKLFADAQTFGIMDCRQKGFFDILTELRNMLTAIQGIDVVLVQRIIKFDQWDGQPANLEELYNRISTCRPAIAEEITGSVSRAPSPKIVDVGSILSSLNYYFSTSNDIRRGLNEILRFA